MIASWAPSRLRVVALVLAGDPPSASLDDDLAERVLRAIRDNKAAVQEVTHYTLLVPTLDSPLASPPDRVWTPVGCAVRRGSTWWWHPKTAPTTAGWPYR